MVSLQGSRGGDANANGGTSGGAGAAEPSVVTGKLFFHPLPAFLSLLLMLSLLLSLLSLRQGSVNSLSGFLADVGALKGGWGWGDGGTAGREGGITRSWMTQFTDLQFAFSYQ